MKPAAPPISGAILRIIAQQLRGEGLAVAIEVKQGGLVVLSLGIERHHHRIAKSEQAAEVTAGQRWVGGGLRKRHPVDRTLDRDGRAPVNALVIREEQCEALR
jgi:hypothetical protein